MDAFGGFPEGKSRMIRIPEQFFTELLPHIEDRDELLVTLYVFWRMGRMEGPLRYLRQADFAADDGLLQGLAGEGRQALEALGQALKKATERRTLLTATIRTTQGDETLYFLNSPKGRSAVQAIQRGEWRYTGQPKSPIALTPARPNIFQLYEENIGPLTPMIADALRDAEKTYPPAWVEEAVRIAVENNKRSWSYIEAILSRWQKGGFDEREDRRDTEKARRRYAEWESSG